MPYQYEPVLDENPENECTDESSTDSYSDSDSSESVDDVENGYGRKWASTCITIDHLKVYLFSHSSKCIYIYFKT